MARLSSLHIFPYHSRIPTHHAPIPVPARPSGSRLTPPPPGQGRPLRLAFLISFIQPSVRCRPFVPSVRARESPPVIHPVSDSLSGVSSLLPVGLFSLVLPQDCRGIVLGIFCRVSLANFSLTVVLDSLDIES